MSTLRDRIAKAIYAVEFPTHSDTAQPEHNAWSWNGKHTSAATRRVYRAYADAVIAELGLTECEWCDDRDTYGTCACAAGEGPCGNHCPCDQEATR